MKKNLLLTILMLFALVGLNSIVAQTINESTPIPGFTETYGLNATSAHGVFDAAGFTASSTVTATAPTGFEVSLTGVGGWGSSVSYTADGAGVIASTDIYIRYDGTNAIAPNTYGSLTIGFNDGILSATMSVGSVTINKYALTITGVTASNKVYDRTTSATLGGTATLSATLVSGDVVTLSGTGSGTFADALAANGKTVTVTGFTLSGAAASRYLLTQPSPTANISKLPLTITGLSVVSKAYDGLNTATLAGTATLSAGVIAPDVVNIVAGTVVYSDVNVGNPITMTVSGYDVSNTNYSVSQPSLTGIITKRPLSILAPAIATRVYDGTTTVGTIALGTLSGFASGELVTATAAGTNYSSKDVGTYTSDISYTLVDGTGLASNYSLASNLGVSGSIIKKPLTFSSPTTIASRAYDGTNAVGAITVGTINVADFVSGETVTATAVGTAYADANVGSKSSTITYTTVSGTGGGLAGNYSIASGSVTGTITAKALTIAAATIASKTYDKSAVSGTVTPGAITGGLVGTQTVTVSATGLYADALVANGKTATITYSLGNGLNGGLAANYSLANGSGTGNITKKALTVTGLTADNKVYDRLTTATYTGTAVFGGVETGDDATPHPGPYTANFANKNVGVGKTVTITGITIDGVDAGNYSVIDPTSTANITAKPLTITSVTAHNKVYDGTTPTTISGGVLGGIISGDVVSIAPGCTADFDTKDAGTNKVVTVTVLTLAGADGGNYSLPLPLTLHADITKAPLYFTGGSIAPREYNATKTPGVITPGLPSGYIGTETLNVGTVSTADYFDTYAGAYPCTLVYALTDNLGTGGKVSNYQQVGEFVNGVVTPKTLHLSTLTTISPKVYDGTTNSGVVHPGTINPADLFGTETLTISGFGVFPNKNTDAHNGGDQIANITYILGAGTNGGYPINYTIANGTAHGSITPKPVNVKVKINNKHFDNTTSATINGSPSIPDADPSDVIVIGGSATAAFTSASVGHDKPVSVSGYTFSGSGADNYIISQPTGCTADITPAEGEIGDRVWQDWDANGIQDDGELGYPGITVELHVGHAIAPNSTPIATAVTDANGKYSFSKGAGPSTANYIYGIAGFNPSQPYTIRIPNVAGANKQGWLGANVLTAPNQGGDDTKDSDADFPSGVTDWAEFEFTSPAVNTDDYTFDFGFTPGGISCGCGGGLESKSLGDAIGNRIFNKAIKSVSNTVDYNKMPAVQTRTLQNGVTGIGTALTLEELLPKQIAGASNYKAFNSTPKDITSITNAKDVLSIDYTLNNTAKAVAFATKTQGEVYDHTKAVCDRLKGAELLGMQNVTIEGVKMVRFDLINPEGQTEYAMSFAVGAKTGRANYTIQSNWLNNDYTPDEVMYNVQLWGASSEVVSAMAKDIVTRLNASLPVKEVLSSSTLPNTYITKGKRVADKIILNINNATTSTNGYFEVIEKANEQSTLLVKKQVPFTVSANGKTTVEVPEGDNYESTINMYINNTLQDQVFMSDGNWAAAVNSSNSSVKSVTVTNDPKRVADNADDFLLFRNVQVEATTPDYVSVYKVLRGGGAPQDLTGYRTFQFTASGKGASTSLIVTIIKNGITNWADQYSVILPLSTSPREYKVNLDDFVSTVSKNKISPSDVTMVIFGIGVNSGNMTTVSADISNVSFTKTDFAYLNSLKSTEISVYPNPATNHFTANFKSATQNVLTMNLTEASTGKVVFSKSVNAQVGNNSVPVSIDRNTGLNTYILSLEGNGIKYTPKKVLMEK